MESALLLALLHVTPPPRWVEDLPEDGGDIEWGRFFAANRHGAFNPKGKGRRKRSTTLGNKMIKWLRSEEFLELDAGADDAGEAGDGEDEEGDDEYGYYDEEE